MEGATIIENPLSTPQLTAKNNIDPSDGGDLLKTTFGTPILDHNNASSKFTVASRSSRSRVADESSQQQQYSNYPLNGIAFQHGVQRNPLSVSVSASNSPFIDKRIMGSKQALLQVRTFELCFCSEHE